MSEEASNSSKPRGRVALGLGLALFLAAVCALIVLHGWMNLTLTQTYFSADPTTRLIVDRDPDRRVVKQLAELDWRANATLLWIALASLYTIVVGLRVRRAKLGRLTAPIWVPALIALVFALLADLHQESLLIRLTPEPLFGLRTCRGLNLDGCSHVRALEWVRLWSVVGLCLAALALIPAGRRAWRLGQEGRRLSAGWSRAAVGCLIAGVLALTWTRAHRYDRRDVFERCEASEWQRFARTGPGPGDNWRPAIVNPSSLDLWASRVEFEECKIYDWSTPSFQLFADGTLTAVPERDTPTSVNVSLDQLDLDIDAQLRDAIERTNAIAEDLGRPAPTEHRVSVYIDQRVSMAALAEWFERFAAVGMTEVLILGASEIEEELATTGRWRRRYYCQIAAFGLSQPLPTGYSDLLSGTDRLHSIARHLREQSQ